MVWSRQCDVASHLAIKAKVAKKANVFSTASTEQVTALLSEFQPNPPGQDPDTQQVEISGTPPGANFQGCIWSVDADAPQSAFGFVHRVAPVSGVFDANGLLVVEIDDLEQPSHTLFLSVGCPDLNSNITTPAAAQEVFNAANGIYDSIGVPDSTAGAERLATIRSALESFGSVPGTDLKYYNGHGEDLFRDASVGDWYQVRWLDVGPVVDYDGNELGADDFDYNPLETTFGSINPTRRPLAETALLSEFQPNPPGQDPDTQQVEISGTPPGAKFQGCIWSVDADAPQSAFGFVHRVAPVSGVFDANGLLVVEIDDLEQPSHTLFLSVGCPDLNSNITTPAAAQEVFNAANGIYDSIGVPDSTGGAERLATIRSALESFGSVPGTDLKYYNGHGEDLFRDASVGDWYQVRWLDVGPVVDYDGNELGADDFDYNPLETTFGSINPTRVPLAETALLSEFQPNPPGQDPDTQQVEISGTPPGAKFQGCIWSVDADAPQSAFGFVHRVAPISGVFDANGLLVVEIDDLEQPSHTLFLSVGCPDLNSNITTPAAAQEVFNAANGIYDSIGVPDSTGGAERLATIRSALESFGSVPGTDLKYYLGHGEDLFRDASVGDWYTVRWLDEGPVVDYDGNELGADDFDYNPLQTTFGSINPTRDSSVVGDPHIHTFKGGRYTLLREGSFLLWHFGLMQPHVEWQIFAHYSGRQSFTKGLLLVDTSGPQPSKMEITAEKCQWQTYGVKGNPTEWLSISEGPLLSTGASSHLKLVGINDDVKKVQFFLADEKAPVATLKVLCRQGRHINVKLHMANQKSKSFVSGQLKGTSQSLNSKKKASILQLALKEDREFEMKKTWQELGGSPDGQQYLESFDHSQNLALLQRCDGQREAEARAICRKHLGDKDSGYLQECVFDVCAGAGEAGAEMAAEILKS
eukprot:Skav223273  [mRNA]  locus=scaffold3424:146345:149119:+ [translate_table: standard]